MENKLKELKKKKKNLEDDTKLILEKAKKFNKKELENKKKEQERQLEQLKNKLQILNNKKTKFEKKIDQDLEECKKIEKSLEAMPRKQNSARAELKKTETEIKKEIDNEDEDNKRTSVLANKLGKLKYAITDNIEYSKKNILITEILKESDLNEDLKNSLKEFQNAFEIESKLEQQKIELARKRNLMNKNYNIAKNTNIKSLITLINQKKIENDNKISEIKEEFKDKKDDIDVISISFETLQKYETQIDTNNRNIENINIKIEEIENKLAKLRRVYS